MNPDSLIERKPSIQSWIQSADMPQARPFTSTSGHDGDDVDDGDDNDDIYIMMKCLSVTKNDHFPLLS